MRNRVLEATAYAILAVVAAYFAVVALHAWTASRHLYLALDVALYLAVGFFAARMLRTWTNALGVVAVAAAVDASLGIVSLILPRDHPFALATVAAPVAQELLLNIGVGLAGALLGWMTVRR